ncbi:MAG: M48 family metallopeptidase [Bryobacteraceae bacterium]|nr:M48 family metallopeptidase [Bryobacteraceae bacterium]
MQVERTRRGRVPESIEQARAAQAFERVFRRLKPRTEPPLLDVRFRAFASATSTVRLREGRMEIRISDLLESAPEPVLEALAEILLAKLYRKPVPQPASSRYRRYLNRQDVRERMSEMKQQRGRKQMRSPKGQHHDLEALFEDLNFRYFHGLMARPALGWSVRESRSILGHYDPAHHAIVLSRALDRPGVPKVAVEYVLFHEMLHLRHPESHNGARRCVHTRAFREAERVFDGLEVAKMILRRL